MDEQQRICMMRLNNTPCTKPAVDWIGGKLDGGEFGELWCCQEHLDYWDNFEANHTL
jgi:hypothetical protein